MNPSTSLATASLFFGLAWLTIGVIVALIVRFVGIPDPTHTAHSRYSCENEPGYSGSCYASKLGGTAMEAVLWVMWTLFWPAPIFLAVFILLIWIMQKAWSFKF